jgi:predicted DNA repair protein MutK
VGTLPAIGDLFAALTPTLVNLATGIVAGAIVLAIVKLVQRLRPARQAL